MKMVESLLIGEKRLGKEKLLYVSNFSFSSSVFIRLVPQTCKSTGLFGKEFITPRKRLIKTLWEKDVNTQHFLLFTIFCPFKDIPAGLFFTYHSLEHSSSCSPDFLYFVAFECNTISD